jgi:hypothetical protein
MKSIGENIKIKSVGAAAPSAFFADAAGAMTSCKSSSDFTMILHSYDNFFAAITYCVYGMQELCKAFGTSEQNRNSRQ